MRARRRLWRGLLVLAALVGLAGTAAADGPVRLQWYGQSAVKITSVAGKSLLIDPWLTRNPATPERYKSLDAIGPVDLILVTHAHADHLGDAPELARKLNVPVYAPGDLNQQLVTLGLLPPELAPRMNKSGTVTPLGPGIRITMVRAEHSSALVWTNPGTGKAETHYGGEPVGFIIELENGFRIYHMGDTGLFPDMKFIADYYRPDLILIPISGNFVMDPRDAAYATRTWLKPKFALPIHFGTNPLGKGTPEEYVQALGKSPVRVLRISPGDVLTF